LAKVAGTRHKAVRLEHDRLRHCPVGVHDQQIGHCTTVADATARTEGVAYKAMFVREEEWDKRPLHSFDQAIAAFDE